MNKGDLMKLVYTKKELKNIDTAVPIGMWDKIDTSLHVINYNDKKGEPTGRLESLIKQYTLDGRKIVKFKQWFCSLEFGKYGNGITAISLFDLTYGEPIATATVNVMEQYGILAPIGHVIIKEYSENEGMTQALIDSGVIDEKIDSSIPIGYRDCKVNICKLIIDIPQVKKEPLSKEDFLKTQTKSSSKENDLLLYGDVPFVITIHKDNKGKHISYFYKEKEYDMMVENGSLSKIEAIVYADYLKHLLIKN